MSQEQNMNIPLIGEICVEGDVPSQYYQEFLKAQNNAEMAKAAAARAVDAASRAVDATDRAEAAAERAISGYYRATREKLGASADEINANYVFGLYDALMEQYPDNVTKTPVYSNDGSFENYVYEISTGEYRTDGSYTFKFGTPNPPIKKPKYLVMSGIHGVERTSVFSTYRLVRDILEGRSVPWAFKEGAILSVMPIGNPTGFDGYTYGKENGVDIQTNFESADPEKETQAIAKWLADNRDAELFIELHNTAGFNEKVIVISLPDNSVSNTARKVALRGVDRVIPLWRDILKYPLKVRCEIARDEDGDKKYDVDYADVIFSYSVTTDDLNGRTIEYAQLKLGIRSLAVETALYYGDYIEDDNERQTAYKSYQPESAAMGAEALGNILIEFYNQPFLDTTLPDVTDTASLTDTATGTKYTLYVENGELKMEVAQ